MWLDIKPTHEGYLAEVKKRSITCQGGKAIAGAAPAKTSTSQSTTSSKKTTSSNKTSLSKDSSITTYEVTFSEKVLKELLERVLSKTDFDFSKLKLANQNKNFSCRFKLRRIRYDEVVGGEVENWDMARGVIDINGSDFAFGKNSFWRLGGLSEDPSYLKNEVNLKITNDGHIVGKMAYFTHSVKQGEVPRNPLYVSLNKHDKSTPINLDNIKNSRAKIFIDVEDWAGGVLMLDSCKEKIIKSKTKTVSTSSSDPTVSKVIEVIQGDKFIVDIAEPHELAGTNINLNLLNIDAPDAVKSCSKQMEFGIKVKDIVTQILADASSIQLMNYRKTSKAVIAKVIVDGKDLGNQLIEKGYASDEYGYWKGYFCSALIATQAGNQFMGVDITFDMPTISNVIDIDKAIFWFERAIVLDPDGSNNSASSFSLSLLYDIKNNDIKSLEYLKKSANLGFMRAEEALGKAYMEGIGVSRDTSEGKYWLKKAFEHGSKNAEDICGCEF